MTGIQFFVPLQPTTIKNPWVVPLLFHNKWFGQDSVKDDLFLEVSHPENSDHNARFISTKYFSPQWIKFGCERKPNFFRKITLGMPGKMVGRAGPLYAEIWLDMNQPSHNCGIALSPVPFGPNGKPSIPYIPGLKRAVEHFTAEKSFVKMDFEDLIGMIRRIGETGTNPVQVIDFLKRMEIIKTDDGVSYDPIMSPRDVMKIFGV